MEERQKKLDEYRAQRNPNTTNGADEELQNVVGTLVGLGYPVNLPEDLRRLLKADDKEEELMICAEVHAYWHVASRKIIDVFPAVIAVHYLQRFAERVNETLSNGLQIYTPEGIALCTNLLEEQSDVVADRQELITRQQRLEEGLKAMRSFGAV